jgi:hypothetical protein
MVGLGTLPGTFPFFSSAYGISSDGSVVVGLAGSPNTAFRWSQATSMFALAGPPIIQSRANAASLDGSVVVGYTYVGPVETDAAIWDQTHGHRLLKDVLVNDLGLDLSGWTLNEATAISPDGSTVVGYGKNPSGDQEAWIAVLKAPEANSLPVANAGPDQTIECAGPKGTSVTLNGSASSDPDGDTLSFVWKDSNGNVVGNIASVTFTVPLGSRTYTLTVNDGKGGTVNTTVTIAVRDSTPPTLSLFLRPNVLWPPNDKLIPVVASIRLKDVCDPHPRVVLVSITSNEPDAKHSAKGSGHTDRDKHADIQGAIFNTDDRSFSLRAERSAKGSGRAYTVTYRARDASGNTTDASAQVTVPLNRRKP